MKKLILTLLAITLFSLPGYVFAQSEDTSAPVASMLEELELLTGRED